MATRIRTLNFLPEIFKTTTNSQFLAATLDQLVAQPNIEKIQGYVGSKFGYGVNATNKYVTEPTKTRTDYQLDPGVVFLKENDTTATDFISYPGIVDALKLEKSLTGDNNRLFESQFYSWDSFTSLDKVINFNQYYWLPTGPDRVVVSSDIVYNTDSFTVADLPTNYSITSTSSPSPALNPTLVLLRGGIYTFNVNQDTQFWIQGEPGVTGYSVLDPNVQTRDVFGVINNGAQTGTITFSVPSKNALDEYNFPGNNLVDVVSTLPFSELNGARVNDIGGIDSITALNGLTVMFYDTGVSNEQGYIQPFYDETLFDQDGGNPGYVYPGTISDYTNFEGGYYTEVNANFYLITLIGDPTNPTIQLTPSSVIPTNQKITARYGLDWINRNFYRTTAGSISLIPYNSAILDTLYYQDSTSSTKVGVIKLIDSNETNQLDIETQILGKKQYTAPNGVEFTNGLKVTFQGDVFPTSYLNNEYYVEGVGTAIELVLASSLVSPGSFSEGSYIPYDTTPYDIGNYDSSLYVPIDPDYITIARNAINKNAWSRSNRWFHIDVIRATAQYNNDPSILTSLTQLDNKAKRPIIEFYPNLRLFNSGVIGKDPVDFFDVRTTDAFSYVAGQTAYYPDIAGWTGYDAIIAPVTSAITDRVATTTTGLVNRVTLDDTSGLYENDTIVFGGTVFGGIVSGATYYINSIQDNTITISTERQGSDVTLTSASGTMTTSIYSYSTTITVPTSSVDGLFQVNQYITDIPKPDSAGTNTDPQYNVLPTNAYISSIDEGLTETVFTISWYQQAVIEATSTASVITSDTTVDNYSLFDGCRIVFAADTDLSIRNKIYTVHFSIVDPLVGPVITLSEAADGLVLSDEQTAVFRGYYNIGKDFYFNGVNWLAGQQKETRNQAPKFDIFDSNGISFGDDSVYIGTSFTGSTLFQYGLGIGKDDAVLGFPIRYSSVDNVGDISFDVSLNSQVFNYVQGTNPITQNVNTGYIYNYTTRNTFVRELGWQTAVSPSVQYQVFDFSYNVVAPVTTFTCDVSMVDTASTEWPTIQVYINNEYTENYTYVNGTNSLSVTLTTAPVVDTVIQVLLLSDQVSSTAYYQVPVNLNNNPFNSDVTVVNTGDIRGQYQSMFYNNPNTTGDVFGSNNYRDLGNMVPWGNKIIQNSASLALPGALLRKQDHNLFNSLMYNSRQYITFKSLLVDTVNNSAYTTRLTPAEMLDDALDQMTANKIDSEPFFWSDMLPSKSAYISNTYSFANSLEVSIYPLSRIYNFSTANYYGVLVYLIRNGVTTQLIIGEDYIISTDSPSLTVTTSLIPNDQIVIKEYNQTYGSFAPNTPTKLGLYPSTKPKVFLDEGFAPPAYFIVGHDGSFTKLYGKYVNGRLVDFRDQVLLEFETRVYNNLKLSNTIPVQEYEVLPGFFRTTDYSYDEILQIYSESFLNWVGQNRIDYKTQFFNKTDQYTYNYRDSGNKINKQPINQGYWRGIYQYFYDTTTPDQTPWEMIGYRDMPTWWSTRYGPAPYTSDNLVLWNDLAQGIDWNNGVPIVLTQYIRPELLQVIPVDSSGNLVSPLISVVGNYTSNIFQRDWQVGDSGPAEFSYRRSSSWPFDLMRILALTKPAMFYNLGVDVDNYKYNVEFNQYLVNDRSHLKINDVQIYGSGTAKTSYINWIVDYEKQVGVDATTNITKLLDNLDVRLIYRLAGFSDKDMLKFYVEKSSANSNNSSLLIPDESYSVLLYDNQPFDRIIYTGVVVQITSKGYRVFGNSQTNAYFTTLVPKKSTNAENITVDGLTVSIGNEYYDKTVNVPYGTEFYSVQALSQFLDSYGKYLESQGVEYLEVENGIPVTWRQMIAELLYWAQMGWEVGSIVTLNPSATSLTINKDSYIVQPLTFRQQNFVLNQNLYPIQSVDLSILRDGTAFAIKPLNQGDALSYGQFNISNFEHGIVFNNTTLFNDTIYNLITGLRQNRIFVSGSKTADWNGTVDAQGFILNQDNILEWNTGVKYTKGSIVKYKNKYWTAIKIVQASAAFNEREWKETDYNEIQKGLLPNSSTRSYESTLYYDVDKANLENDADLLSFSLIGYRPRDYLALADLTDITQVNVYKNMIKSKGTADAVNAFKGANLPQGGIDYQVYENWSILTGEYGGVLNKNFVEFKLSESELTGNPFIVGLTNGQYDVGVQQEVPLYSLYNYGRPVTAPNILQTLPKDEPNRVYPSAGYVNFNDVKMSSYYYSGLPFAQNAAGTVVPINDFYVRDYTWLADYLGTWRVYTPSSLGSIVNAKNNLNGTVTITFSQAHNLSQYELFAIVNFNQAIDNYYLVTAVIDPFRVAISLSLDPSILTVDSLGVGFKMQSQRVASPTDINTLPLLDNEFNKLKVWVDTNTDGSWAVYRKSLNFTYQNEITKTSSETLGSAVAYTPALGYLVGDADKGEVYRYVYDGTEKAYVVDQTITNTASFGSTISYTGNDFVISQPTGTPKVYVYEYIKTTLTDEVELAQTITAPGGVTNWGSATAISDDSNWLYISDINNNTVYVYKKSGFNVAVGGFTVGHRYQIVDLGDTTNADWNTIADTATVPRDYVIGSTFTADIAGTGLGTGVAMDITYKQVATIDGDALGLTTSGDNFGYSLSTDYYGDTLVVGTPNKDYSVTTDNYGYAYVFSRAVQNFEASSTSNPFGTTILPLAWVDPTQTTSATCTTTTASNDRITTSSPHGFVVGNPVVFTGTILSAGAISQDKVYYIASTPTSTTFTISLTRGGSVIQIINDSGSMTAIEQTTPLVVSINGTVVQDSVYAVTNSNATLNLYSNGTAIANAGDIINVSSSTFTLSQSFDNGLTPRVGVKFGTSVATNNYANEILVGAPFELDSENQEGAVHRFTNVGEKYGIIVGTSTCAVSTSAKIMINGYAVTLDAGNASDTATRINNANITNVFASEQLDAENNGTGKLIISLIDSTLAIPSSKLSLTSADADVITEMGIDVYTETQVIKCPHAQGPTQFGSTIKFNEFDSIVVSAPTGTRYTSTTFDFTEDETDNDTVFDNNATQWVDTFANAGAVYMFDYLSTYNENIATPGQFVYAQSVNATDLSYGSQPMYGHAIDFTGNVVVIGTPNFIPNSVGGQVVTYTSLVNEPDWSVYRSSSPIVDINGIENIQLFSASTNNTLDNLDYFDPLQGKILGAVRQNIDFVSNVDPAGYNSLENNQKGIVWGADKVGQIWFNTSNTRFVNYHQNDIVYNSKYWGKIFPGSDVAVYTWVTSNVPPVQYTGPGTAYSLSDYTTQAVVNAEGAISPVYFFWARNTNIVIEKLNKTLADSTIQSYIAQPQNSGISYFAPLLPNVFALYNSNDYVNANDTVLHINFATGLNGDVPHNLYSLIRANYADDFLPGVPSNSQLVTGHQGSNVTYVTEPESLYDRMLDSMCGVDETGSVVPNPLLPKSVQTGVLARPRQSFFYNRYNALKNYFEYANEVMSLYPITEIRQSSFLFNDGIINPSTVNNPNWSGAPQLFFDTQNYWEYTNWWATGYSNNTKSALQVSIYADLATLVVEVGTIVTVAANSSSNSETYIKAADGSWTRIGLTNGTIRFKSILWDYSEAKLGFGDNFFDTDVYDAFPSEETRSIVRALNEQIYTNDLLIFRNKSLILLFEYIQSETIESQNYLPWLNKTSFIDVAHTVRELRPIEVYRSDYQDFLSGYINEVKPYHVVIKEFLFKYSGIDVFEGDITDFDLPAQYNSAQQNFISPQLVFSTPTNEYQYGLTDPIWETSAYSQWFSNYGLSLTGQPNYAIAKLVSYVASNSTTLYVDNVTGFPVTGTITLGTEQLGYTGVDLATNALTGLSRGANNTKIQPHVPGEQIYTDLPAVLVTNGGREYIEPPQVIAYIDTTIYPAPRVEAQLRPIMGVDSVIGVEVINPGEGYVVLPTISIEPALVINIPSTNVDTNNNTFELSLPSLQTGDLIVYEPAVGSTEVGGLVSGQHYYVGVLETSPSTIIALYSSYINAISNAHRVVLTTTGTGTQTLSLGAIASTVTSAAPVRENILTLRYDRTSYTSQVVDWAPGTFYGSFYAGSYNNSERVSSSSISLYATQPLITSLLASAQGATFEIVDVTNDQLLTWSSRTRETVEFYGSSYIDVALRNVIKINPSTGGSPVEGALGSTIGFYPGMPVKFVGAAVGGVTDSTVYYVYDLVKISGEDVGFRISTTVDTDGNPGSVLALSTATVPTAGLTLYVGETTNTAVATINYDGIRNVTETSSSSYTITAPLTSTGFAGTTGFYTGLPIFFTGNVFGGIEENEIYYVTSIIDLETFTMSTVSSPLTLAATGTTGSTDAVSVNSTLGLTKNQPIMFTGTTFGGITSGQLYYVSSILSSSTITLSTEVNGSVVNLSTASGSCTLISQANAIKVTSGTGSMVMNVGIPVSPGQIDGQQVTMYTTSSQTEGLTGTASNLITRTINSTLSTVNRICLAAPEGNTDTYAGIDFEVAENIGGLTTSGGPYTVTGTGTTELTVTNTSASGNWLTLPVGSNPNTTDVLYVGMPVYFGGVSLGGVSLNTVYYVESIDATPPVGEGRFTISEIQYGTVYTVNTDNGTMTGTGEDYVVVADTLTTETGPVTFTQFTSSTPTFSVRYILGGYQVTIEDDGTGFAVNNIITIPGDSIPGGTAIRNDVVLTVLTVGSSGEINSLIVSGNPPGAENQYFIKVLNENQIAFFENEPLTVPVSGLNFPYSGVVSTTATVTVASSDRITVTSSTDFNLYDEVVFTGTVFGGVEEGISYYVVAKPTSTTVQVSLTIDGTAVELTDSTGSMSMAKIGDIMMLPEPFFFDSSIVKYNNRVYQCVVSNNDPEFIFGKWELLSSGDRRLNELDRIVGYYQPTANMPGVDLTQLVEGITYPNSTYMGNPFAPAQEYNLDTILTDQPFYPTGINVQSIIWNGLAYVAAIDTNSYTALSISPDATEWAIDEVTSEPIGATDLLFADNKYILTSTNSATPILTSTDAVVWTNSDLASTFMNCATYNAGTYVVVGENIRTSTDGTIWTSRYNFNNSYNNSLNSATWASTGGFAGFVAVGEGQLLSGSSLQNVTLVKLSSDGIVWSDADITTLSTGFNSVTSTSQSMLAVGNEGKIYSSFGGTTWFEQTSGTSENLNKVVWLNDMFVAVGDNGTILTALIDGSSWTLVSPITTENLQDVTYNADAGQWIAVGENNTILISNDDAVTWEATGVFATDPTVYNVQGDTFTAGYGPEEMVPGVVTDTITMTVATRPGTNWDVTEYQHCGYNVASVEVAPTSGTQTVFSFLNAVSTPAQVFVAVIDYTTGISTTIYEGTDYTINWISKEITLSNPLYFVTEGTSDVLRIDVYEVGNGDQLVKANTETDPIRVNTVTGFQEIYVNANYSAGIWQGSGVIRPGSEPIEATAISTNADTDTIKFEDVSGFVVNGPITFSGNVFGGIIEDTVYYVKTVNSESNRITISEDYNTSTGTAGQTFGLTTDTGNMIAIIQVGTGTVWSDPVVYRNGTRLVLGASANITRTTSGINTITCNTTGGMIVNTPIVFSKTMIGGVLPHDEQVYFIKSIYDANEFTISETVGGAEVELTDAVGGASFITNDFSIGLADNGISAALVFAADYDATVDYINYTLFGETIPVQYGATIPQTQLFTGETGVDTFNLDNFVGDSNPDNAIVEIDGLRQTSTDYTIDPLANTIEFVTAPSAGATISVTTYNLTDRQYFSTEYGITGSTVSSILNISNEITSPIAKLAVSGTVASPSNYVVCSSTASLAVGQSITFQAPIFDDGAFVIGEDYQIVIVGDTDWNSIGYAGTPVVGGTFTATGVGSVSGTGTASLANVSGIDTTGIVYYVRSVIDGTQFTIEDQDANIIVLSSATQNLECVVGGQPAVSVTTASAHNLSMNEIVRIDGVLGSVQLNNNLYYARVISDTQFELYLTMFIPAYNAINNPVTAVSAYVSGGYAWLNRLFIVHDTVATATSSDGNRITAVDTSSLVINTPVFFTTPSSNVGDEVIGGLIDGTEYFIQTVNPEIVAGHFIVGNDYQIVDLGNTTQLQWNTIAGTSGQTYIIGDTFTCANIGTGTGIAQALQEFTLATARYDFGTQIVLSNATGTVDISQFQQDNPDRLWVTVNGYRVPSSKLRLNSLNNLSILSEIQSSDEIIITSMMPSATPNEEVYMLNVTTSNIPSVFRANTQTRTWLVRPVNYYDSVIYLNDASRVTDSVVQTVTASAPVDGIISVGLTANKHTICHVTVMNDTTGIEVSESNIAITIVDTAPILVISGQVSTGDQLTITTVVGDLVYINGEQIRFTECDLITNTISGLVRGANGTGAQNYIPLYTEVFGIIPSNKMTDTTYSEVWNSYIYNTVDGDPLQVSETRGANFLILDRT